MLQMLRSAFAYRGFILSSVRNEIAARFARSRLGAVWAILHPLSQVLIYTIVLSNVLSARMPGVSGQYDYALYLIAGFIPWALFSEITLRCLTVFIEFGPLLQKIVFPKICLPIIVFLGALWNNLILIAITLLAYAAFGSLPSPAAIPALVLLTLVTGALALGIGLFFGVLNVFFRDVGQTIPVVLQFTFWLTPIVYALSIIPEEYRWLFEFNPLAVLVDGYHDLLLFGTMPDWGPLLVVLLIGGAFLLLALALLRRAGADMVDVL